MAASKANKGKIRGFFSRLLKSPALPYLFLFMVLLVLHIYLPSDLNDDSFYRNNVRRYGMFYMLEKHYHIWSARLIIEYIAFSVVSVSSVLWRILNPLFLTGCLYIISYLGGFNKSRGANILACCLLFVYDWSNLASAGWIITSIFFVWTAAAASLCLVPTKILLEREKNRLSGISPGRNNKVLLAVSGTAGIILCFFAANMEQVMVLLLLILSCCFVYSLAVYKKIQPILLVQIGICIVCMIFALSIPGPKSRASNEIASYFNNYPMRSLLSNMELGISTALFRMFFSGNFLFLLFYAICAVAVWKKNKKPLYRLLALEPIAVTLIFGVFRNFSYSIIQKLSFFTNALTQDGIIRVDNCWRPASLLPFLLLCFSFGISIINIYTALGHNAKSFGAIYLYFAAFCSSAMMGFSPTIWSSGSRIAYFQSLCVIAISGHIFKDIPLNKVEKAIIYVILALFAMRGIYSIALDWVANP